MESDGRLKQGEKEGVWRKSLEQRRQEEQEQRRHVEQEQTTGQEQGKKVHFGEEEQSEETRAESTDEPEVTSRLMEVRTGRGSAGLVRSGDERCWADETSGKGKGKGTGGKSEHEGKGGSGSKGMQQGTRTMKDEDEEEEHPQDARKMVARIKEEEEGQGKQVRAAPNMVAGASHPQAMSDPAENEGKKRQRKANNSAVRKKEEILRLPRGWRTSETSSIVRWA